MRNDKQHKRYDITARNILGKWIRQTRKALSLSRRDVSDKMDDSARITPSTIGQIERKEILQPPKSRLAQFARIFNVSLDFICSLIVAVSIAWFSHGATSAVTCALALEDAKSADDIVICSIDATDLVFDPEDNARFESQCCELYSRIIGEPVTIHHFKNESGFNNHFEVLEKARCIHFPKSGTGAPCTKALKTDVNQIVYRTFWKRTGIEYFGLDITEQDRADKLTAANPDKQARFPLIEKQWDKNNCIWYLESHGITAPKVYNTFCNNNCVGCAKASNLRYWLTVKEMFPEIFNRMARLERTLAIGKKKPFTINRIQKNGKRTGIFLDELPSNAGRNIVTPKSVKPLFT